MATLNPYIAFDKNCKEAMTFYKNCLGGDLRLQTVASMPEMAKMMPNEDPESILHAMLTSGDMVIMGSDLSREKLAPGNNFSICVNCTSEAEITKLFTAFSEKAHVFQPLGEMPWNATYGELKDQFGIVWTFNYQK